MTVAELLNGRGTPTPLQELAVAWPEFFAYKRREAEREDAEAEREAQRAKRGRV